MRGTLVLVLSFSAIVQVMPLPQSSSSPLTNLTSLIPTNIEQGTKLVAGGGRMLADHVRTTSPEDVQRMVQQVGNILSNLPPPPKIDQQAAGNIIESGAKFLEDNAGNIQSVFRSLIATNGTQSSTGTGGSGGGTGGGLQNLLSLIFGGSNRV